MIVRPIDRDSFFEAHHAHSAVLGPLSQKQVANLGGSPGEGLLGFIESDPYLTRPEWGAYELATAKTETGDYSPKRENAPRGVEWQTYFERKYGYKTAKGRELGNTLLHQGWLFCGKGFCQLTGYSNYFKLNAALHREYPDLIAEVGDFDLVKSPEAAMVPEIAYAVMSSGLRGGRFTGVGLSRYFNGTESRWHDARRMVNGLDRAGETAAYGRAFLACLTRAGYTWVN